MVLKMNQAEELIDARGILHQEPKHTLQIFLGELRLNIVFTWTRSQKKEVLGGNGSQHYCAWSIIVRDVRAPPHMERH